MSILYKILEESESSNEDNNDSRQDKKKEENGQDILFDMKKTEENYIDQNHLLSDNQLTKIDEEHIISNESANIINSKENDSSQIVSESNDKANEDTLNIGFTKNEEDLAFFSESNKSKENKTSYLSTGFKPYYPILSETFIPTKLQFYSNYQYPHNNTIVFTNWENVLINAIHSNYQDIDMIKSYIMGTWFIDSSNQFIQINYFNINTFLSKEVLEETNLFNIDLENNTLSLKYNHSLISQSHSSFVFNKNKDLPFLLLVLDEANNLSADKSPFSLEDLFILLNQKTYRTPVNTYEYVIKEDLFRIQYIIEQSAYFTKTENGLYTRSEIPFGEFIESELTSNDAVNAMIKSAPIGHCFYRSELKKILENDGIQFSEEEIILNERVFYFSGRFGVRPNLHFKKQPRIRNSNDSNISILNNVIVQTLSEISKPISIATLFSVINGKKYFYEANSSSTKIIDEQVYSSIRSFMNLQPFIFCKNNEFFMIPKSCECDQFGYAYNCLICDFLQKNGDRLNNDISIISKFNELRFPIKKNEAVFIQTINSASKELQNFFEIPKLTPISNTDKDYIELFNSNKNDGEISKDSFTSKSSTEHKELILEHKINSLLSTNLSRSNSESTSTDFYKKAKKKKILLDIIPDHQEAENEEVNRNKSEDDFEIDSSISDLEKKLIRLARKYYNPKILTYSTPKSFVDELVGQKSVNKDGIEFIINNDQESVELVTKELLSSERFISNKEHEKFCYIGKIENQPKVQKVKEKKDTGNNDADLVPIDNDDSKDMFSNLNIFGNSSEDDDNMGKMSNSGYYSSSESDVSDSNIGIENELSKWEPPKIVKRDDTNKKHLSIVRDEKRNLPIEPFEFTPKRQFKINQYNSLKDKLKRLNKSKDHVGPDKYQLLYLYTEFGNGMALDEFENHIIEIEGTIFGESH